ncbi:hypothetical protein [Paenisporosarcina sp. TG-14]|uniref:hypothetical protein n=1 Tax=Paenisporosarcina sp. TG-14 TaxID=1231057 RepID=UPI0003155FCD|nr:hypothetical protein [Paenisporosarcina sp. TG-14]
MVIRTIANKVGTFEIEMNTISYLQPLSTFNTQEMNQVQKWYKDKMYTLQESTLYLPARDISFQSGQVCYTYDVTGLKSFNALKTMYLEDKLPYYLSLIQLAKEKQGEVLWETENLVIDGEEASVKALVMEHQAFAIENEKSPLSAVKDLIVISLTNLQQVYGRPKRSDFFEQNEEVINFAEMIYLRLDSLDQMASFVQSLFDEIQERKQIEQEELGQELANKKRFSISKLVPVRFLQHNSEKKPEIRTDLPSSQPTKKAKSKKEDNIRFLIGAAAILVVALLLNILLTGANKNAESPEGKPAAHQEEKDVEQVYLEGLLGDTESVMKVLEAKDYDHINKDETELLHQLWIKHGSYEKYLEKDELAVSRLTEYMTKKNLRDELDQLQEILKVSNPHIGFANGVLEREWDQVLANREGIELTEDRKTHIVTAFLQVGDIKAAKTFVSEKASKNDGLMNRIVTAEKKQVEMATLEEKKVNLQKTIDDSKDVGKVTEAKQKMDVVKSELNELKKSNGL